jgi:pimeloyl-ACP methyl ester carboxylesterase
MRGAVRLTMALVLAAGPALPSTAAKAETPAPAGAFAAVDGDQVWYESCGSGPKAIVLIHDGILHSAAWDGVWPILCRSFHVVRYDRRGYGRSPEASAPYAAVDDLAAVMKAAGIEHATLVGSSAGGGLAVDFALQHPQAVDRLVLAGAAIGGFVPSQHFIDRMKTVAGFAAKGDIAGAARDRWVLAPEHDAARRQLVALLAANPQDITHRDPARPAPAARPRLPEIKAPVLILVGEDDIPDVQAQAGALEALIPGARRVVVPDAGHLMYLEHPEIFADLVGRFDGVD